MLHRIMLSRLVIALIMVLMLAVMVAYAQSGSYDLSWNTIDSGGGQSIGNGYTLAGTIGQADAGATSGNEYTLIGGFWAGMGFQAKVYLPLVQR